MPTPRRHGFARDPSSWFPAWMSHHLRANDMTHCDILISTAFVLGLAACGGGTPPASSDVPTADGWRVYEDQYTLETSRAEPPDEREDEENVDDRPERESDGRRASADEP